MCLAFSKGALEIFCFYADCLRIISKGARFSPTMTKRKEEPEMIPPREYAERAGANYQTVMLWLRQNLIPGAQKYALPTGGHYYLVPADAPKPETRRGPKPKKDRQAGTKTAAAKKASKKGAAK